MLANLLTLAASFDYAMHIVVPFGHRHHLYQRAYGYGRRGNRSVQLLSGRRRRTTLRYPGNAKLLAVAESELTITITASSISGFY